MTQLPMRLLAKQHGDRPFRTVPAALRCSACRGKPAPAYLVADFTRTFMHAAPPGWALALVPPPAH